MLLNQELLDKIFTYLRQIHTAHWKAPKMEIVDKEMTRTGAFVFRIGSNPWVSEIKITKSCIEYTVNKDLPENLKKQAINMKKRFDSAILSS